MSDSTNGSTSGSTNGPTNDPTNDAMNDPTNGPATGATGGTDRADLVLGRRLGRGGRSTVHEVPGRRINGQFEVVYKEYDPAVLPGLDAGVLTEMAGLIGRLPGWDAAWLCDKAAWPAEIVRHDGAVRGFLMRSVPHRFSFDLRTPSGTERRPAAMELLLNHDAHTPADDPAHVSTGDPADAGAHDGAHGGGIGRRVDDRDRLLLLADLADTLARLHAMDIVVGDLSPEHLLFATDGSPECFLIGCDMMRLAGAAALPQVETPGWEIPADEPDGTPQGDAYRFALLAVRLLARDRTSTDPGRLAAVAPAAADLAAAALNGLADERPRPGQWAEELREAAASATPAPTHAPPPPPPLQPPPPPPSPPLVPSPSSPPPPPPPSRGLPLLPPAPSQGSPLLRPPSPQPPSPSLLPPAPSVGPPSPPPPAFPAPSPAPSRGAPLLPSPSHMSPPPPQGTSRPPFPGPGGPPPSGAGLSTGMKVGLGVGLGVVGVALVVAAAVIVVSVVKDLGPERGDSRLTAASSGSPDAVAPTPSPSPATPGPTETPTLEPPTETPPLEPPTETPTLEPPTEEPFDPGDLDRQDTDPIPLTPSALLPSSFTTAKGVRYTLRSSGVDKCPDAYHAANVRSVLRKARCSKMVKGSYVNPGASGNKRIMVSVWVVPLKNDGRADTAYARLDDAYADAWGIVCPRKGPGSGLCHSTSWSRAQTWGWVGYTHRYLLHTMAVYTNRANSTSTRPWLKDASKAAYKAIGPKVYQDTN
ncbi:hypothetical protein AB0J71_41095 [Nonomuraea sp. NPDC049637]|uniref:hypothetical protein n=1 Tax=Nonomuraea sp. NPDC049637 TaxID=3154356 RepID=UPI003414AD36